MGISNFWTFIIIICVTGSIFAFAWFNAKYEILPDWLNQLIYTGTINKKTPPKKKEVTKSYSEADPKVHLVISEYLKTTQYMNIRDRAILNFKLRSLYDNSSNDEFYSYVEGRTQNPPAIYNEMAASNNGEHAWNAYLALKEKAYKSTLTTIKEYGKAQIH